ncbi:hypothetical protein CDAR_574731 [Caerostris darwini]|uniref:Uncharacterized protein n=1 Tax=Caerostris darwini TaxID=1538125 RepID=A0AAV4SX24_9ARAC|nr:hypothetical protein CDAR_574731 [Caerostris darwini]
MSSSQYCWLGRWSIIHLDQLRGEQAGKPPPRRKKELLDKHTTVAFQLFQQDTFISWYAQTDRRNHWFKIHPHPPFPKVRDIAGIRFGDFPLPPAPFPAGTLGIFVIQIHAFPPKEVYVEDRDRIGDVLGFSH